MSNNRHLAPLGDRSGVPFYKTNPSIPSKSELSMRGRNVQIARGGQAMVFNGTGEILGKTSVAFMEQQEVEPTRFVKIYLDGVRRMVGLGKAGLSVFEMVYAQLQEKQGEDQVALSAYFAKESGIEQRTYNRGLRELLDKELLFASPVAGVFFVNIQFLFNGDRLHFIKSYYLRGSEGKRAGQSELGFGDLNE